ncbi:hypothetical protein QW180_14525 [Vibrio sinaloensis]|nr:hypothetical protein [Vibrio sinaloensis]
MVLKQEEEMLKLPLLIFFIDDSSKIVVVRVTLGAHRHSSFNKLAWRQSTLMHFQL